MTTTIAGGRATSTTRLWDQALTLALILGLLLGQWPLQALSVGRSNTALPVAYDAASGAVVDHNVLPLPLVPNIGQFDPQVRYQAQSSNGTVFFTEREIVLSLPNNADQPVDQVASLANSSSVLRLGFDGANAAPEIQGLIKLPGVANYYLGNDPAGWYDGVTTYRDILYSQLYDGIDLHYTGSTGSLKSTYFVAPGSDPSQIRLRYTGAQALSLDSLGNLKITLPNASATSAPRTLTESAPVAWQVINGERVYVDARYALNADGSIGFALGGYNPAHRLIIDPALIFGTYLGGAGDDQAFAVEVDSAGASYVTGQTDSATFPGSGAGSPGVSTGAGLPNVFVTKVSGDGTQIAYSTFFGGGAGDTGYGIAVDSSGRAYITGSTASTDFPTSNTNLANLNTGGINAFAVRLTAAGAVDYSTYIGSNVNTDVGYGIDFDSNNNAYIVGTTQSSTGINVTPVQGTAAGGSDAFVAAISNVTPVTGIYFRYIGGFLTDDARAIYVDGPGNAYITGQTNSTTSAPAFPTTAGTAQTTPSTAPDAFVTQLNPTGAIVASTFLGGNSDDFGRAIVVDEATGSVYVAGETQSSSGFAAVGNAVQSTKAAATDAFVSVLSTGLAAVTYRTYLGGNSDDIARSIDIDSQTPPNIYVVGESQSTTGFPINDQLLPTGRDVGTRAFITKILPAGGLDYSTFLGGAGNDIAYGVSVLGGVASVAGATTGGATGIYTNTAVAVPRGDFQGGSNDAFLTKVGFPTLSVSETALLEGNAGTTNFVFTATLGAPSSSPVTITYQTAASTTNPATAGTDFTAVAAGTQVIIPAGITTSNVIVVPVVGETLFENNENFLVQITNVQGAELASGQASRTGTIINDDTAPTITVTPNPLVQNEGNSGVTPYTFTVTLSGVSGADATVSISTTEVAGGATSGSDFTPVSTTLTIPAGQPSGTFEVSVTGDLSFENTENFNVVVTPGSGVSGAAQTVVGTITNDDSPPSVEVSNVTQAEGNGGGNTAFTFVVSLTAASALPAAATFSTVDGTGATGAVAGSDFTGITNQAINFVPGQVSQTVTVNVVADNISELDETFGITFVGGAGTAANTAVSSGTILNDDIPVLTLTGGSVVEGNPPAAGPVNVVTATLSFTSATPVVVDYLFIDQTTDDFDFPDPSGQITIPANSTGPVLIPINLTRDTTFELDETFLVSTTVITGATIPAGGGTAVVTITNDDTPPTFTVDPTAQVFEGSAGPTTPVSLTVTLGAISGVTSTFLFTTTNGTAIAGGSATLGQADYTAVSGGILRIPAGSLTGTVVINTLDDAAFEGFAGEVFSVTVATDQTAVTGGPFTSTITIFENDPPPQVTINSISRPEGNTGTSPATPFPFTVSISPAVALTATVEVSVASSLDPISATIGVDVLTTTQVVTFTPGGPINQTVVISVVGDLVDELDETFFAVLDNPFNAAITLGGRVGVGTILNDDNPGITIVDGSVVEGDTGTAALTFTVALTATTADTVTVTYTSGSGTAVQGTDFVTTTGTLTFTAGGSLSQTVTVPVIGDDLDEVTETLSLSLSNPTNAFLGRTTGIGSIIDDDDTPIAVNDTYVISEDLTLNVPAPGIFANDTDGDTPLSNLSATIVTTPTNGVVTVTTGGAFVYVPRLNFFGTDQFTYRAVDPGPNQSNVATVVITVTPVNDPPTPVDDSVTTPEDQSVTISVLDNDFDVDGPGQIVRTSLTLFTNPTNGTATVISPTGTILYTPTLNFFGVDRLVYRICDTSNACNTGNVTVTVSPVNDPPVANNDTVSTDEDTPLTIQASTLLANDTDVDTAVLTITAVSLTTGSTATVTLIGSTIIFTPGINFNGTDSFRYTVSDGELTSEATVVVTIRPVNDAPDAVNDRLRVDVNSSNNSLNVLANDFDADNDPLTIIGVSSAINGRVSIAADSQSLVYTPNPRYSAMDVFSYTIRDSGGNVDWAIVRVDVGRPVQLLPLVARQTGTTFAPDLIASFSVAPANPIAGQPITITVYVTNTGIAPARNFWVDFYVNPTITPTVNSPWNEICEPGDCIGIAWLVTDTLFAQRSTVLTSTIRSYVPANTIWPGTLRTGNKRLFVFVDTWNRSAGGGTRDPEGAVEEQREDNNLSSLQIRVNDPPITLPPVNPGSETQNQDLRDPKDLPERYLPTN